MPRNTQKKTSAAAEQERAHRAQEYQTAAERTILDGWTLLNAHYIFPDKHIPTIPRFRAALGLTPSEFTLQLFFEMFPGEFWELLDEIVSEELSLRRQRHRALGKLSRYTQPPTMYELFQMIAMEFWMELPHADD